MELPQSIRNQIEGKEYQIDETGMSGSRILLFPDMVLKVQRKSRETEQTSGSRDSRKRRGRRGTVSADEQAGRGVDV